MEIQIENLKRIYSVYYRFRKITPQQNKFVNDLISNLLNFFDSSLDIKENYADKNLISNKLFEFPPTLDKEFLYISCIFTLLKEFNNKKVVILVKGIDKINSMMNICSQINQYYYKKNKNNKIKYNPIKVIPFYSRKQLCYNYDALKKSNTYDMDSYCIKLNASTTNNELNCKYYKAALDSKILILNKSNNSNANIDYPFQCKDIEDQMNILFSCEKCPFYYYLNNIEKNNYNIIICERDYFFDNKKNISIRQVIGFDEDINLNKFLLVLDEFNDYGDYLTKTYSCVIDKQLLEYSQYQLFELVKLIKNEDFNDIPEDKIINNTPETEIIRYNLFYNMKKYEFSGALRSHESLIDWIKRLIIFCPIKLKPKDKKKVLSPFEFEKEFFDTYNIEINILEQLYKRLITFLNHIKYFEYHKIYHLIHFIYFISTLTKYNEKSFVINNINILGRTKNQSITEYLLLTPNEIINRIRRTHHVFSLTGGIGEEKIVKLYHNFLEMFSYEDDNNLSLHYKTNLYLVNNTRTTSTDVSFYGEILKMLATSIPDGIICYFPNITSLYNYTKKWMKSRENVFSHILNNKLIFIEESNSQKLSEIIVNYKKTINNGRGAFLFLTLNTNNKSKFFDDLTGKYSRCILFIGCNPDEMLFKPNTNQIYEIKRNFNKITGFENTDLFECVKLFISKITNKIQDRDDKTILIILEEENDDKKFLLSNKYKDILPKWIKKMIHIEEDDERNNINEKIKLIPEFLSLNNYE